MLNPLHSYRNGVWGGTHASLKFEQEVDLVHPRSREYAQCSVSLVCCADLCSCLPMTCIMCWQVR